MQILSAEQIRLWDQYTIRHEPVSSPDLMERAASRCFDWIRAQGWKQEFHIFCGKGNNGGDGLVIARLLLKADYRVWVHILEFGYPGTPEFQLNLERLHETGGAVISYIQEEVHFPAVDPGSIVVDAIFGSGLNKALTGLTATLVEYINKSGALVVAIDMPTGLFTDRSSRGHPVIRADYTLTFQCMKTGLLVQENGIYAGEVILVDIGLHPDFLNQVSSSLHYLTAEDAGRIFRPRLPFAHKGNFGHALLAGGSRGKMGAMVLAVRSCVHAGAGLTTCFIPGCGYEIMQSTVPESMVELSGSEDLLSGQLREPERFSAVGAGPGMGTGKEQVEFISWLLGHYRGAMVLDADALNCLSIKKELLDKLPPECILTPHPREFDRLFGEHDSDFDRIATMRRFSAEKNIIIVLKGHHSLTVFPTGDCFFNSTGNPGMAKGGSGDVLTGMITALLAQGYTRQGAALLGVYLHGFAGDAAAATLSQQAMAPGDMIIFFSRAFLHAASLKAGTGGFSSKK